MQITNGATTVRSLTYDNAGNLTSDSGLGGSRTYTYNKRNRLSNALIGAISWDYTYNGQEQLIIRQRTGSTALGDLTHYVHDIYGNVIAETNGGGPTGTTGTVREYIYLPEAEIAPTFGSRTTVDRPVGVVEGVHTASPVLWFVHVDHLNRPVKMTDTAKAAVWDAIWLPWGGVHAITGSATLDARFPGQWFQLESGLHYNWHRQYDPSIGRYTQPDPLGFVDGPSVYGYVRGMPGQQVDPTGELLAAVVFRIAAFAVASGGANAAWQLWNNGGKVECIDWKSVASSAIIGAVGGAATKIPRGLLREFARDTGGGKGKKPDLKQFKDALNKAARDEGLKSVDKDLQRKVHDEISGQNLNYKEIVEWARDIIREWTKR